MLGAVEFVQQKLAVLLTQESATALEQNEKLCSQADGFVVRWFAGVFRGLESVDRRT